MGTARQLTQRCVHRAVRVGAVLGSVFVRAVGVIGLQRHMGYAVGLGAVMVLPILGSLIVLLLVLVIWLEAWFARWHSAKAEGNRAG